jgi:ornithine carbamoyltransferase
MNPAPKNAVRHFLDIDRLETATLRRILEIAQRHKRDHAKGTSRALLASRTLVMIFEKPSTRTRVSFQVAMQQLGGHVVVMSESESQLGRGETIADTARVLSRYADAIMIRTDDPKKLDELETHATVPVINGLTDFSHPCQIMADVRTFEEHRGPIKGKVIAWSGDGNNVAQSWIHAAVRFGFTLRLACPEELRPHAGVLAWAEAEGGGVTVTDDPTAAVENADLVVADTWISMGTPTSEGDANTRRKLLAPYRVDAALMARAKNKALFMHCLPAHREEEVTSEVMDGPHSVIWDEAENRLHAQKGILAWCLERPESESR